MILNNMERIKIGFNWEKCDRLRTHLEETAKYANSVLIPLFKEYGLATDIEDIISACNQKEHFYKLLKGLQINFSKIQHYRKLPGSSRM